MVDVRFVLLGAAISVVGQTAYIRDTLRGVTQPNRVSFALWGFAPLLAFAAELSEGEGLRSLTTLMFSLGPIAILIASFNRHAGVWKLGRLDYVCGAISLAGTAGWLLTRHSTFGIAAAVAADAVAGVPMFAKVWRAPETETPLLFVTATANGAIGLLTVDAWTTASVAFPLYIVVFGVGLTATYAVRTKSSISLASNSGSSP